MRVLTIFSSPVLTLELLSKVPPRTHGVRAANDGEHGVDEPQVSTSFNDICRWFRTLPLTAL